jgi:hypothetical protein
VRRAGYVIGLAVNLGLVWAVTVTPGWRWVPFLTEDFSAVVGFVLLSLLAGAAVNLLYLAFDPPWLKRLGDAATGALSVVVLALLVRVFPFALGPVWAGWETPIRILLVLVTVGAGIGVVVNLALALRELAAPPADA